MPASLSALGDLSSEHLLAKDGRMGFVLLRMTKETGGFAGSSAATDELRRIIRLVSDRHAGVTIGLTGLPVMEDDEMRASQNSMIWASSLSMAAVIIVIIAGFGGVRHAMMANGVLVIGMAWAFAWATFSVGHLNILSVTFTVTMIGVGIDYGTYYVGRYLELRREGIGCDDALLKTSASVNGVVAAIATSPGCTSRTRNFPCDSTSSRTMPSRPSRPRRWMRSPVKSEIGRSITIVLGL